MVSCTVIKRSQLETNLKYEMSSRKAMLIIKAVIFCTVIDNKEEYNCNICTVYKN